MTPADFPIIQREESMMQFEIKSCLIGNVIYTAVIQVDDDTSDATKLGRVILQAINDGVDMSGIDLSDADISGADLRDADMSGFDMSGVDLNGNSLNSEGDK